MPPMPRMPRMLPTPPSTSTTNRNNGIERTHPIKRRLSTGSTLLRAWLPSFTRTTCTTSCSAKCRETRGACQVLAMGKNTYHILRIPTVPLLCISVFETTLVPFVCCFVDVVVFGSRAGAHQTIGGCLITPATAETIHVARRSQ